MKKVNKLFALIMAIAMMASIAGCGSNDEPVNTEPSNTGSVTDTQTPENPSGEVATTSDETLRVLMTAEPGNILPQNGLMGDGQLVAFSMFDTLLIYNSDTGENEPGVAKSWEWIDDYHIKFELRDDVVAYDGTIVTAHDVLWSCQMGVSGTALTFWKAVDINECSAPDDFTFILGLNQIYPTIMSQLSNNQMLVVLDQSSCEANGGWEACIRAPKMSTSAYFFEEWVDGDHITLVRNDNYWGEPGYYKYIELRFVGESAARVMALAAGEADVAIDLSAVDMVSLQSYPECNSVIVPNCGVQVLMLNTTNEYLANEKIREAIYYAVDANAFNQLATGGVSNIADGPYEHTNAYYSAPAVAVERAVDLDKAKQCMAEAGYPDGGFSLYMPVMSAFQTMAEAVQADLLKIGIDVKVELLEGLAVMMLNDTGDFDMGFAQTFSEDAVNICNYIDDRMPLNTRGGGIVGTIDGIYDQIDLCRYTQEDDARLAHYATLQDMIRESHAIIPLYDACSVYGTNGNLDIMQSPTGFLRLNTATPIA